MRMVFVLFETLFFISDSVRLSLIIFHISCYLSFPLFVTYDSLNLLRSLILQTVRYLKIVSTSLPCQRISKLLKCRYRSESLYHAFNWFPKTKLVSSNLCVGGFVCSSFRDGWRALKWSGAVMSWESPLAPRVLYRRSRPWTTLQGKPQIPSHIYPQTLAKYFAGFTEDRIYTSAENWLLLKHWCSHGSSQLAPPRPPCTLHTLQN